MQKNDFHSNVSLIIDRIRNDKEKAFQFLNEKEAAICREIRSIEKVKKLLYEDRENQTQEIHCTSEKSLERISNASRKSKVEVFLEMKEVEKQCKGFESMLDEIKQSENYIIKLIDDKALQKFMQTTNPFGKINTCKTPKVNFQSASVKFSSSIKAEDCRFTDVCSYCKTHILALSEDKNMYIFSLSGKLKDKTMLSGKPWALTKFLKKNVAVSIRSPHRCIQIFEIKPSSLNPLPTKEIPLEFEPLGIQWEDNMFIVSSNDSMIRWISDDGTVKQSVPVSKGPIAGLCCQHTLEILYFTNESENKVNMVHYPKSLCFTQTKDILPLKQPVGLCCDSQDNIYVVGYSSKNVVQVDPDGTFVRELIHE
ncbi:uncharacterized protein LOC134282952 [Saccostrea cucullata]|uniref:uncharacterized protein LOC134282952 n=1 Tax=Saccostrea cuccullata TaxID=36930 RepID=UPI002ED3D528